jgi:opacity protein-like surface antigen
MKKLLFTIALVATTFLNFSTLLAQNAFEIKKNYISVGYGLELLNAQSWYPESQREGYKFSSLGPITMKYEHALGEEFGLGLVVGYSKSSVSWIDTSGVDNYNYSFKFQKITAALRMNWHFFTDENWNAYAGVGMGYKDSTWKLETNDDWYNDDVEIKGAPIALSLSMGVRYYFSPNLGLFLETGMGHGFVQCGLQVKL